MVPVTSRGLTSLLALGLVGALLPAQESATAKRGKPGAQIKPNIRKMDYHPIGFYEPGEPIPPTDQPPTDLNPSGKWVAYDNNVFESLNFPARHPGDTTNDDPPGNGGEPYGFCPQGDPTFAPWGNCEGQPDTGNHQLEYLDYYERAMSEILGDFGVVMKRYRFDSPGRGPRGAALSAAAGRAINISATVPGVDHPDESVLVSGHYDFTDSGPAAAWDSSEGHATVIRIARIMADYWRATGSRPSATVKFIPWDSEESGTFGSVDYVQNNIPPGEELKVRGYFNLDPCAGAYPAFRSGNGMNRVPEVLQLADPSTFPPGFIRARVGEFNARAETIVDEVFEHLDDTIDTRAGPQPIFVSDREAARMGIDSQRDEIVTALGGLALFSSDYTNFSAAGIPIFNLFPDFFGPHADNTPASAEGAAIIHTPRDNLTTVNALTSADQSGLTASEGWAKGMEMCAHINGWYMLQPEMGGAARTTSEPVAYFEALPNETIKNGPVTFDASGTYRYANANKRKLVQDSTLKYAWDFGDGTRGKGKVVTHAYAEIGAYEATLTVTGVGGARDTMTLPITVVGSNLLPPILEPIPAEDAADGTFELGWTFDSDSGGFDHFSVQESTTARTPVLDGAEGDITELWTPGPSPGGTVQPWQRSDTPTAVKTLGNQRHSGEASYWTGNSPSPAPAGTNLEVTLTLTEPVRIPKRAEATFSYRSLFAMELDDEGRVEVAIDDGDPKTEPAFQTVDRVTGTFCADEPEVLQRGFEPRTVDLSTFAGKTILLRFRWVLGETEGNRCQPAGWYVDDIRFDVGSFVEIGTATEESFKVKGKPKGKYGYRVLGVYEGAVTTAPSNTEYAKVTGA